MKTKMSEMKNWPYEIRKWRKISDLQDTIINNFLNYNKEGIRRNIWNEMAVNFPDLAKTVNPHILVNLKHKKYKEN